MKVVNQFILKCLLVFVFISEMGALISLVGTGVTGLLIFINPQHTHLRLTIYDLHLSNSLFNHNIERFSLLLFFSIIVLIAMNIALDSLRKLLINLLHQQYFTLSNLYALRWLLIASLAVFLIECGFQGYLAMHNSQVKLDNLGVYLLITALIYVIEQVFAQGLILKTDNDYLI